MRARAHTHTHTHIYIKFLRSYKLKCVCILNFKIMILKLKIECIYIYICILFIIYIITILKLKIECIYIYIYCIYVYLIHINLWDLTNLICICILSFEIVHLNARGRSVRRKHEVCSDKASKICCGWRQHVCQFEQQLKPAADIVPVASEKKKHFFLWSRS
jgi:hypothetical protein